MPPRCPSLHTTPNAQATLKCSPWASKHSCQRIFHWYEHFLNAVLKMLFRRLVAFSFILLFVFFYSITFPKQYVWFEFNTSDYFFIKITATLWAFRNSRSHMWHYTHKMCFTKKFYDIQSHGLIKDQMNFELRVRREYGLLPLLSWSTTCFWVRLQAGLQKFGTIRLIAYMHICNLCGLRTCRVKIW